LEKLGLVTAHAEVMFYAPGLPREYHASLWGGLRRLLAAIEALARFLPRNATIALIPEGRLVLARTRAHDAEEVTV
jgi:hypothetical protein